MRMATQSDFTPFGASVSKAMPTQVRNQFAQLDGEPLAVLVDTSQALPYRFAKYAVHFFTGVFQEKGL
jgi:hypothetical protein